MRALAVLPVLVYHAFPKVLHGGFFGVDIFFVISGFLISGIIFRGLQSESFSYRTFYAKRIRRIVPNLVLLLTFVAVLGWCFLLPDELKNLGKHIYSSAGFVQNIRLLKEIGYFTEDALRKPLLHLWSLAIEEQFYIVFPILCTVLWRFWKSKFLMVTAVVLITVCSLEACLMTPDKNTAFYFPLTRFWELGAGILLAAVETFGLFDFRRLAPWVRNAASLLGFIFIAAAMALYRTKYGHPGWVTLIPVIGAVLLIAAQPDALVNRTLLSWRPMTFVGLISYSLYLWHWPLLAFLFICEPQAPKSVIGTALALSFVLSAAVYRFVEQPMRRTKRFGKWLVTGLLLALVLTFAGGKVLQLKKGFPERSQAFMEVQKVREVGEWTPFNHAPSFTYEGVRIATPSPAEFPSVIFAGDSHTVQYYARAEKLSIDTGHNVGFIGRTGCVMFAKDGCKAEAAALYRLMADPRVKTVAIGEKWVGYLRSFGKEFRQGLDEFKTALAERPDLRVFILLDYPWVEEPGRQGEFDPLRHLSRWRTKPNYVLPYPKDDSWKEGNDAVEAALAGVPNVTFIRPETFVCPDGQCNLLKWYKDDDHLQPMRLKTDGVWLNPIFR